MITFTPDEWLLIAKACESAAVEYPAADTAFADRASYYEVAAKAYDMLGDKKGKEFCIKMLADIELEKEYLLK